MACKTLPPVATESQFFNKIVYRTGIIGKVHVSPDSSSSWRVRKESESRNVAGVADKVDAFLSETKRGKGKNKSFYWIVAFVDPYRQL